MTPRGGFTRRRFVEGALGAGVVLALPAGLSFPVPAGAVAEPGWSEADYWACADRTVPLLDSAWRPSRGYYSVPGGGETSLNADLLYTHAAAAHAGHQGPCRNDQRARTLAMRLLEDPPCRAIAGAARASAAAASCTPPHEAYAAGDQTHDWGWGCNMETTGGQHVVIDTAVVRALAMAYAARKAIGLTSAEADELAEHVRAAAYSTFYFYPALRLNQINWPIEIYLHASQVTGDSRLLRNDCRAQLTRFAAALTRPIAPWRIPFTGAGYRWHYLPQYSERHPRNLDSAEYATIVSQAAMFYGPARRAGMRALSGSEKTVIRAWLDRVLCGYWTHAGYLNWDTGLSFARWHQAKKHGLCLASLLSIALAGPLKPSAAHGRWAKHMFDRGLELFLRGIADGRMPPAVPYGITATERGDGDGELYAARMAASAAQAAHLGLGELRSEEPPPLYAYDPDIGRLAITTPHYNTAILAVNQGAVPYGGVEPARLFDGDQRVAASIGGRPYASFGFVVTDAATGHRTATQIGRAHPDLAHPPLRLTRAPRGVGAHAAHPRHAYAGAFHAVDAEGWTTGRGVRIRSRHRFRARYVESEWTLLPQNGAGRQTAHATFPSWGEGATVTAVLEDGSRHRLTAGKIGLADVAWFELMHEGGGYVVVPRTRPRARVHLLHPAAQSTAPHPGPTMAVELLNREHPRRIDFTVRYAPARDAADARRVAALLRSS
jgi:hypothetical protein